MTKYNYQPKTKEELKNLIKKLIKERGNEADLNDIDVSLITDMSHMFRSSQFNGNISKWDVSKVRNMDYMFADSAFNNDISNWDVSNVETMKGMFRGCFDFSGDLSKWNVSKVWNMSFMFADTYWFNSDISNWDVSRVITMEGMFAFSYFERHEISKWSVNVDKVNMVNMIASSKFLMDRISKLDAHVAIEDIKKGEHWWANCNTGWFNDLSNWDVFPQVRSLYSEQDLDKYKGKF